MLLYTGGAMDKPKSKPVSKAPKKSAKPSAKVGKASASVPASRPYPVEPEVLELQQRRLKTAAAAGAHALKSKAAPAPRAFTPAVALSPVPAKPADVLVRFVFRDAAATSVHVSGEFNQWSTDAAPMKCLGDGRWEILVALAPGRYQYKLIVNGVWIADPLARENVMNEHGSFNSVIEVSAESNINT